MVLTPLESWISDRIAVAPLTREGIEAYQLAKLRETLEWAKGRSPFYRSLLAGSKPICGLEDLARLPFTTAEDIRREPLQFLCVSQGEISRVVTLPTSGTTGEPKRVFFTVDDLELTIDFFCHGMSTLVGPGDRVLILLPGERPGSVGDLLIRGLDRLGATGIVHGPVRDVDAALAAMEWADALVGIPVQLLALARIGKGRAAPRSVLLSTDHVPEAINRALQELWGCEVFTHYGMTEMGYGGGVECRAHFGYHLREADLLFEVLDPISGTPVEEGGWGELVITTLTRLGMPLIRYRTGDISRFIPNQCPCGTVLKTLEKVRSRVGGQIPLGASEALSMADLDDALFPLPDLLDFRATLTREAAIDRLHIAIHTTPTGGPLDRARRALDAIPSVRGACQSGRLALSVSSQSIGWAPSTGLGKRRVEGQ